MIDIGDSSTRDNISLARAVSIADYQLKIQAIDIMDFIGKAIRALEDNSMVDAAIVPDKVFAILRGVKHTSLLTRAVSVVAFATAVLEIPKALQVSDTELMISKARGDRLFYVFGAERGSTIRSLAHDSFKGIYCRGSDMVISTVSPSVSPFLVYGDIEDEEVKGDEAWSNENSGDISTNAVGLDQRWYKVFGGQDQLIGRCEGIATSQSRPGHALKTRTAMPIVQLKSQWLTFKNSLEKLREIQEGEFKQRYSDGNSPVGNDTLAFLGATQIIHTLTASWCSLYTATSKASSVARDEATVPNETDLRIATAEAIASGIELARSIQLQQELLVEVLGPRGRRPLMNDLKHLVDTLRSVTCTAEILSIELEQSLLQLWRHGNVEIADDEESDFASCIGAKAVQSNKADRLLDPSEPLPDIDGLIIDKPEPKPISGPFNGPDGPGLIHIIPSSTIDDDIFIEPVPFDMKGFSWNDVKFQGSRNGGGRMNHDKVPISSPLSSRLATMESYMNASNSGRVRRAVSDVQPAPRGQVSTPTGKCRQRRPPTRASRRRRKPGATRPARTGPSPLRGDRAQTPPRRSTPQRAAG
jgi:hypothetical protein